MPDRRRRPTFDVRDFGTVGTGTHPDGGAIHRAMVEASPERGVVRFPPGRYLTGTVELRSGVTVVLESGATVLGSRQPADFRPVEHLPYPTYADHETSDFQNGLFVGDDLTAVTITGTGTIDMQYDTRFGPKPIALRRCVGVEVSGITIRNAPNYCVSLGACDDVLVEGVTVRDAFSDGIDPDSCRHVRVVDCDIESDDDALCLKSSLILGEPRVCEDVVVRGCRLNSPSNGFKIGTETSGDIRDVDVEDCRIVGTPRRGADPLGLVSAQEGGGVAIESVDGAHVTDVRVRDVVVEGCDVPIFVRLGARGRGQDVPRAGVLRAVTISRLLAAGATDACTISGVPGHPVEDLALAEITLHTAPRVAPPREPPPERVAQYPQAGMFGPLPASGVYARHVRGLRLQAVSVVVTNGDERPHLVTDDVTDLVVE
jgi:polygalacturonase